MSEIYQLKIETTEINPKIERIIWIKSTATFLKLHDSIQWLFGFDDSHLFEFYVNRNEPSISDGQDGSQLAGKIKLSAAFSRTKKMFYMYDFGDSWEFSITLQKIVPENKQINYPYCIDGTGGMLIEDCGGSYCYNLLAAWCRNKTKETKKALLEQFDEEMLDEYEDFDPDKFDKDAINRIIGKK